MLVLEIDKFVLVVMFDITTKTSQFLPPTQENQQQQQQYING